MLGDPRCCHWQLRRLPVTSCILRRGTHRVLVLVAGGSVSNTYLQKRGKNHARNIRMFHSHGYVIYGATFLSQNFEHDARAFELRQLAFPIPSLVCSRSDHLRHWALGEDRTRRERRMLEEYHIVVGRFGPVELSSLVVPKIKTHPYRVWFSWRMRQRCRRIASEP